MHFLVIFLADYLIFLFIPIGLYFFFIKKDYPLVFQLILCVMFEKMIEMAVKTAFFVPRPYVVNHLPTYVAALPTDSSFFSGHSAMAAVMATVIFLKHKRVGIILLITACIIGGARVAANVHYPIDIFSGLILGVIIGFFCGKINIYARHHNSIAHKSKKARS